MGYIKNEVSCDALEQLAKPHSPLAGREGVLKTTLKQSPSSPGGWEGGWEKRAGVMRADGAATFCQLKKMPARTPALPGMQPTTPVIVVKKSPGR